MPKIKLIYKYSKCIGQDSPVYVVNNNTFFNWFKYYMPLPVLSFRCTWWKLFWQSKRSNKIKFWDTLTRTVLIGKFYILPNQSSKFKQFVKQITKSICLSCLSKGVCLFQVRYFLSEMSKYWDIFIDWN